MGAPRRRATRSLRRIIEQKQHGPALSHQHLRMVPMRHQLFTPSYQSVLQLRRMRNRISQRVGTQRMKLPARPHPFTTSPCSAKIFAINRPKASASEGRLPPSGL